MRIYKICHLNFLSTWLLRVTLLIVVHLFSLSGQNAKVDKHPEKRVKAAYNAYEEQNLPRLKAENPNMRLSQLKQMLKKDWMKSPENPLNQRHAAYNEKR